ncbi:MAG TPA: phosphatase PAP2 family protein [Thermoanaerobaculia bacterium]|jgi:membrane-associated phospholipid phosphatase|nr:phosphatase PAP2 family protein [Thermoanaerobaculia bacterium]
MEIVRWVQHFFGVRPHTLFLGITFLGASVTLWSLLVLYHWLVDPRFGRRLGIVLALSIITNQILKGAFGTDRPYDLDATLSTESARSTGGGHGFPSGHTQNASTFWPAFAFRFGRMWLWVVALLIVFAVALSRIYLGVHMPVDVTGGFIFGMVFAWVAGGWDGPRPRPALRWIWGPLVGAATLVIAFLGAAEPAACGLLAGCFLARPTFAPPKTAKGRITIVAGGLAVLALLAGLLLWLPDRLSPGLARSLPAMYLQALVLSLVAFDLWPRAWQKMVGERREEDDLYLPVRS